MGASVIGLLCRDLCPQEEGGHTRCSSSTGIPGAHAVVIEPSPFPVSVEILTRRTISESESQLLPPVVSCLLLTQSTSCLTPLVPDV